MNRLSRGLIDRWVRLGPEFLPFADAASPDLPLSRLLRLSLFQVSVGMALVLLIGTLNRVMIVELGVPASIVAVMISLPLIFAPFRVLVGFQSDTHVSALGWRRVPFIWKGTMLQFGGLAIMPFALLVLSGGGNASQAPAWIGQLGAGIAFLLVGAGMHMTQTVGLALATDLAPKDKQPQVVGLMYVMLMVGMIITAILFGYLLADFSPGRLVQVIQGSAVATLVLNITALWKQEMRDPARARALRSQPEVRIEPSFSETWQHFSQGENAKRRLAVIGLGTMAFCMEDVLLEPYGGQILHLPVATTTALTATLAIGGLFGFGVASRVLKNGFDPIRMACIGAMIGIPAFAFVILSSLHATVFMFALGTLLIGFGCGLFGHGTLTATMQVAPDDQSGLALGAWGAVQASAAGLAVALGGILRDVIDSTAVQSQLPPSIAGPASGYVFVYSLEIVLLVMALVVAAPLVRGGVRLKSPLPGLIEERSPQSAVLSNG
jgi:MFS transporter, BCD family, chlorophyll transporter